MPATQLVCDHPVEAVDGSGGFGFDVLADSGLPDLLCHGTDVGIDLIRTLDRVHGSLLWTLPLSQRQGRRQVLADTLRPRSVQAARAVTWALMRRRIAAIPLRRWEVTASWRPIFT